MSLLFFFTLQDDDVYYDQRFEAPKRKFRRRVYEVVTRGRQKVAEEIKLESFAKEVFAIRQTATRQRQEEELIIQMLLNGDL